MALGVLDTAVAKARALAGLARWRAPAGRGTRETVAAPGGDRPGSVLQPRRLVGAGLRREGRKVGGERRGAC